MRFKYLLTIFILFTILFSSTITSSEIFSEEDENEEFNSIINSPFIKSAANTDNTSSWGFFRKLLDGFLKLRFAWGTTQYIGRYFNYQLMEPTPIQAFPEVINVEYYNQTTVVVGGKNPLKPDEWQTLLNLIAAYDWGWIYNSVSFRFELIPLENISQNALTYSFDPEVISISPNTRNLEWTGQDNVLKTNFTFELMPSDDATNPTEDIIFQIKVIRQDVSNPRLMRFSPEFASWKNLPKNKDKLNEYTTAPSGQSYWTHINRIMWNSFTGFTFWLINKMAGLPDVNEYVDSIVNLLVRVKKDHFAELIPPEPINIRPNDVISIPVAVKNLGSHIDTFNFNVKADDGDLRIAQPSALTLEPGETKNAFVTVSAPPVLFDQGKTISIEIEAFSLEDPETTFSNIIILTTQGVYVSVGIVYYLALAGIILLILIALIIVPLRRRRAKICIKPIKPWDIPEEKEHLEKLKEKDKKEYSKELEMMEEEYRSVLLWYKFYIDSELKKGKATKVKQKKEKIKDKEKRKEEKIKDKEKRKEEKIEAKLQKKKEIEEKVEIKEEEIPEVEEPEPEIPEKVEERPFVVDREAEMEKRRKEKILQKIKREQEFQKRKLKKLT